MLRLTQENNLASLAIVLIASGLLFVNVFAANFTKAPRFDANTLEGASYSFDVESLSKPHLLVFWASWCRECRYEFHELSSLHNSYSAKLEIVGISIDKTLENAVQAQQIAKLPYVNLHDPEATVAKQFQVKGTPTLVLIDHQGLIVERSYRLNQRLLEKIHQATENL